MFRILQQHESGEMIPTRPQNSKQSTSITFKDDEHFQMFSLQKFSEEICVAINHSIHKFIQAALFD